MFQLAEQKQKYSPSTTPILELFLISLAGLPNEKATNQLSK
jgi:hypothetical protein